MERDYEEASEENRQTHTWSLKGHRGAVHVWARENSPDWVAKWGDKYTGGVERHSPVPVYSFDDAEKPHHANCRLLGGPCWHDGTSLYFIERIAPHLGGAPFSEWVHRFVNSVLDDFYESNFGMQKDDTND